MQTVYILYRFNIFCVLHVFDIFKSFIHLMWIEPHHRGRHLRLYHSCPAQVVASLMINYQNRGIRTEIVRSYPADTSELCIYDVRRGMLDAMMFPCGHVWVTQAICKGKRYLALILISATGKRIIIKKIAICITCKKKLIYQIWRMCTWICQICTICKICSPTLPCEQPPFPCETPLPVWQICKKKNAGYEPPPNNIENMKNRKNVIKYVISKASLTAKVRPGLRFIFFNMQNM